VPQREPLDIDEEQRLVAEDEVPLAPAEPCVGVPEVPSGVVGSLLLQAGRSVPSIQAACTRPVTVRGWLFLSRALVEAALVYLRYDTPITRAYRRIAERRGRKAVRVPMARCS
jgi:hypothetical protein